MIAIRCDMARSLSRSAIDWECSLAAVLMDLVRVEMGLILHESVVRTALLSFQTHVPVRARLGIAKRTTRSASMRAVLEGGQLDVGVRFSLGLPMPPAPVLLLRVRGLQSAREEQADSLLCQGVVVEVRHCGAHAHREQTLRHGGYGGSRSSTTGIGGSSHIG